MGDRVFIPAEAVDRALQTAPSTVDLYDRRGEPAFRLGGAPTETTRFGIGVTNLYYQDPQADIPVPFTGDHMGLCTRLGQALNSYDVISTVGILQDKPPDQARPVRYPGDDRQHRQAFGAAGLGRRAV